MAENVTNEAQREAWNGAEGAYWSSNADHFDQGIVAHHIRLLAGAQLAPGERVLDVGCGNGRTTLDAAHRVGLGDETHAPGEGTATGFDLSAPMLAVARSRADRERIGNATFVQADVQVHEFEPGACDVVISRFGCMFFEDPVAAYTNLAAAVRPGGRLAVLAWQALDRNEWLQTIRGALAAGRDLPVPPPDAPSPFSFADPVRVREVLGAGGWREVELTPVEEQVWLGRDAGHAYEFASGTTIASGLLADLDDHARAGALGALRAAFDAQATPDGVALDSAAWLITARR